MLCSFETYVFVFLFTLYFLRFPSLPFLYIWFFFWLNFEHVNIPICRVGIRNLPNDWFKICLLQSTLLTTLLQPLYVFLHWWVLSFSWMLFLLFHFQMGVFYIIMVNKVSLFSCTKFIKWRRDLDCNCTIFDISTFTMWCTYFKKKHCANNV